MHTGIVDINYNNAFQTKIIEKLQIFLFSFSVCFSKLARLRCLTKIFIFPSAYLDKVASKRTQVDQQHRVYVRNYVVNSSNCCLKCIAIVTLIKTNRFISMFSNVHNDRMCCGHVVSHYVHR